VSTTHRLESLLSLAKEDPDNAFIRYGLAMEFTKLDRIEEALQTFRELVRQNPLYVAAYYQLGTLLAKRGEIEEARRIYSVGIEVASQKSDWHAKSELETALGCL
jgi:tetratricopeptide (TPR) repeat protein